MNPEQLSDAMNELPQELLEETQAARSRRRPRWKPLAAAAACLLPELGKRAFAAQLGILSVLLGGISNQWDRLRRGSVTDYLQFPHRKAKKRALVWNLADFMLIGGVVLTVAGLVKELIKK